MKNNVQIIEQLIKKNQSSIFSKKPSEIYRKSLPRVGHSFPIVNFIDFKVKQESTNKSIKLKNYLYLPSKDSYEYPTGIVYMHSGMGSHTQSGAHVGHSFAEMGLVVAGHDYRGFGLSEGYPGDLEDMDAVIRDCEKFMDETEKYLLEIYKNDKSVESTRFLNNKFLCGNSMGGYITIRLSSFPNSFRFKGIILFAPAVDLYVNPFKKFILNVTTLFCPRMSFNRKKGESQVSKNPEYSDFHDEIIAKTQVKLRTVNELVRNVHKVDSKKYEAPFLIIIPGVDKQVPPQSMLNFYKSSRSIDKEVWYYENCWHSIFQEEEIYDIMKRLKDWIDKRVN